MLITRDLLTSCGVMPIGDLWNYPYSIPIDIFMQSGLEKDDKEWVLTCSLKDSQIIDFILWLILRAGNLSPNQSSKGS